MQRRQEWQAGPQIRLASNKTRTVVWHIPLHYRYIDYHKASDSVVERASLMVSYVEAGSRDYLDNLEGFNDERKLKVHLLADVAGGVVNIGTVGGGAESGHGKRQQESHPASFSHAALVIYCSTKTKGFLGKESTIDVKLDICVEPVNQKGANA